MTEQAFVIEHVEIWSRDNVSPRVHVLVEQGVVTQISPEAIPGNYDRIDASGLVLLPAGVDPQVHLRVPGQPEKETASSGLDSAVRGGYAALLTMPNTKPVIDSVESCELARRELAPAESHTGVKVLLSAAMTKGQKGQELVDFDALAEWGVAAFTDDGVGLMSDSLMKCVLAASERTGLPILQHAEVVGHGGVLAPGPIQEKLGVAPYPSAAEVEMVRRDLSLMADYPEARYHVLHISSKDTLGLVGEMRQEGYRVSCEVSPHHLWFSSWDISESSSSFKMNPPLRSPEDRHALQVALGTGTVDFVATDHAPHETRVKGRNFKTAAYGTTGMETALRVLLSLHAQGSISKERLVDVFSYQPARFLGLDRSYGSIEIGRKLHAVLVDPNECRVVEEEDLAGQSKNSCFLGSELYGDIKTVFLGTKVHQISW